MNLAKLYANHLERISTLKLTEMWLIQLSEIITSSRQYLHLRIFWQLSVDKVLFFSSLVP